ncbi:MAG: 50S ribosomal protein L10 [Actinomycetes bacterium]
MENPRPEKVAVVEEVREKLADADAVVLTEYRGLSVTALAELRTNLRAAGGEYRVYKNTLVRRAAAELDLGIDEQLTGPTALAFVGTRPDGSPGDAVLVAKALKEFAKANPLLVLKGGILGDAVLGADEVKALADVAPREELLARLAGGLAAPMRELAGLLQAVPQKMAYALSALIEAGGAPGAPAASPADDSTADTEPEADAPSTEAADDSAEATTAEEPAADADDASAADAEPATADPEATETPADADEPAPAIEDTPAEDSADETE